MLPARHPVAGRRPTGPAPRSVKTSTCVRPRCGGHECSLPRWLVWSEAGRDSPGCWFRGAARPGRSEGGRREYGMQMATIRGGGQKRRAPASFVAALVAEIPGLRTGGARARLLNVAAWPLCEMIALVPYRSVRREEPGWVRVVDARRAGVSLRAIAPLNGRARVAAGRPRPPRELHQGRIHARGGQEQDLRPTAHRASPACTVASWLLGLLRRPGDPKPDEP